MLLVVLSSERFSRPSTSSSSFEITEGERLLCLFKDVPAPRGAEDFCRFCEGLSAATKLNTARLINEDNVHCRVHWRLQYDGRDH